MSGAIFSAGDFQTYPRGYRFWEGQPSTAFKMYLAGMDVGRRAHLGASTRTNESAARGTPPTLRTGMRGAQVIVMQDLLLSKGYSLGPSGPDGIFGAKTADAVRAYQQDRNLPVNGVFGPESWAAASVAKPATPVKPSYDLMKKDKQASGTWAFREFAMALNVEHDKLAKLWPRVRALAPSLSPEEKTTWNALVYSQQGMELQLAAAAAKAGNGSYERGPGGLGAFAGLPGGGAHIPPGDPRFAVPALAVKSGGRTVEVLGGATIVGAVAPLVIGAWVVVGIVAAIILGMTVTASVGRISGHSAAVEQFAARLATSERMYKEQLTTYDEYAKLEREAGRVPVPPPPPPPLPEPAPPPSGGSGLAIGLGLLALGVLGFLAL